jgi:hypothetical protein
MCMHQSSLIRAITEHIEDDPADVPFEDCWYARPQLFFTCHLCPAGGIPPKNPSYKISPDDMLFQLVFFSTFEELHLPIHGPMEDAEVIKLYDPSPIPCLYVAPVTNVLGRVPLIPLFLAGNSTATIPHKFSKHKGSAFPIGSADTADAHGRRGSNVYEVNPWLWMFARGKPRLGGLSVEETALKKCARQEEQVNVQWRLACAGKRLKPHQNEACVWLMAIAVLTSTYPYVPVCTCFT